MIFLVGIDDVFVKVLWGCVFVVLLLNLIIKASDEALENNIFSKKVKIYLKLY